MHFPSRPTFRVLVVALVVGVLFSGLAFAQDRPLSPKATSSTQIGDAWIDVTYSAPILRGRRDVFGSGDNYGKVVYAGAPIWRAGADVTTRIKTGLDLDIGGTKLPAGEYSFFIDLKEGAWTAVFSTQEYMEQPDRAKMEEGITWGAYSYSSDHDVLRAPMTVTVNPFLIDQLFIGFTDVTDAGGRLDVGWDNHIAGLAFTVAK